MKCENALKITKPRKQIKITPPAMPPTIPDVAAFAASASAFCFSNAF